MKRLLAIYQIGAIAFSAYFRPQNASGSKKKYDSLAQSIRKNGGAENASTENASTMADKKTFGTSQVLVWVHFQVGWASGLQIVFSEIT